MFTLQIVSISVNVELRSNATVKELQSLIYYESNVVM